jgi:hypothetical protein
MKIVCYLAIYLFIYLFIYVFIYFWIIRLLCRSLSKLQEQLSPLRGKLNTPPCRGIPSKAHLTGVEPLTSPKWGQLLITRIVQGHLGFIWQFKWQPNILHTCFKIKRNLMSSIIEAGSLSSQRLALWFKQLVV